MKLYYYFMKNRIIVSLLAIAFFALCNVTAQENTYFFSGNTPESPLFVLVAPDHQDRGAIRKLEEYESHVQDHPPQGNLLIARTHSDFPDLPEPLAKDPPEGTAELIKHLSTEDSVVMLVLLPGKSDHVTVHTGVRGDTSPRWLVESVVKTLQENNIPWSFKESRLQLYRMGWVPECPIVGPYHRAGIPVIAIESSMNLERLFTSLAKTFSSGITDEQDHHYIIQHFKDSFFFFGERPMVSFIIAAFAIILLFLFFFSFLFGGKAERRLKYILSLWWLPFIYVVINIIGLYAAQGITAFLLRFRFGNSESWTLLPIISLGAKFVFAWFIATSVLSLNQIFRFPDDAGVYGYLATFCAMVNIFIFSAFDFSLSPIFIVLYGITFLFYHLRHPAFTLTGLLILLVPLIPYMAILLSGTHEAIAPLYIGSAGWNFRLAFLALPSQLMIASFFHSIGFFGRKTDFYLPVQLFPAIIFSFVFAGALLFFPAWSAERPLPVSVRQHISETGNHTDISAVSHTKNLKIKRVGSLAEFADLPEQPEAFLDITVHTRRFLDKQLADISIMPAIPANRIEVTISTNQGLSVYSATLPFTYLKGGEETFFVSPDNPTIPFSFHFSSDEDSQLKATIRMYSRSNPYGINLTEDYTKMDYVLEVVRTVDFPTPEFSDSPYDRNN